ncbi:hypothetical protein [Beduinella massiliensis]|uniref:hypothetical protein n=1 Tax=Beduinella massiliensis TaxID=1852363 RepID=UPI000C849ADA
MTDREKHDAPADEMAGAQDDAPAEARELTPEEQALEARKLSWEVCAASVRERAQALEYLTLTELCAQLEMERDATAALMDEVREQADYQDICVYKGAKDLYYYTYPKLAHNYVKNVALAQENDLPRIIAEVVRYESKTYPRATAIDTFSKFPYHFTEIQVKRMLEKMSRQSEYEDIQLYESGQKNLYIFSTQFLSRNYASSLVEMSEDKRMWL